MLKLHMELFEYLKVHWFAHSYSRMVLAAAIIALTVVFKWLFVRVFNRTIARSSSELNNDPTNYRFLRHALAALIYIVGFSAAIYLVPALRNIANSMLAGAGILAVAVGFASQQALANIISGVFIVLFKPFRVNDRVQLQSTVSGVVEDITLRHTVIRNFENRRVIIPNSIISQETLVNSDIIEEKICAMLNLGVDYTADMDRVRAIIQEQASNHPSCIDNRTAEEIEKGDPKVRVRMISWGESSINVRAWVWAENSPAAFVMMCDLHESLKKAFDKEGIGIPFPHRTLVFKNNEDNQSLKENG